MLEGVICPQSEEMAHVPVSFEAGERRQEKGSGWGSRVLSKDRGMSGGGA